MKTMNRDSVANQAFAGLVLAVVAVTLMGITDAGAGGAYAIMFGCLTVGLAFWIWPEVRERFSRGRSDRGRSRSKHRSHRSAH